MKIKRKIFFIFKYSWRKNYVLRHRNTNIFFSVTDFYSKKWFFPRYDKGKIHEPVLTNMLLDKLKKNSTFFDIGVHLGYFTCLAASRSAQGGVYGFELERHVYQLAKENVVLNNFNNVTLENLGVGDIKKEMVVDSSSSPNPSFSLSHKNGKKGRVVNVVDLDTYCKDRNIIPDFIKIDVEGAELLALRGMRKIMKEYKPEIFIEIHGEKIIDFDTSSNEIFDFIRSLGYETFEVKNHRSTNPFEREILKKINRDYLIEKNTLCYLKPLTK